MCSGIIPIDGDVIIPKGGTSTIYINDNFDMFSRKDLEMYDSAGEKLEKIPGTLNIEQKATVVDEQRLLDHSISSLYLLEPSEIDEATQKNLDSGKILETNFNYYAGYNLSNLFIMKTGEGIFGLVGEPTNFEYCTHDAGEILVEDEEEAGFGSPILYCFLSSHNRNSSNFQSFKCLHMGNVDCNHPFYSQS